MIPPELVEAVESAATLDGIDDVDVAVLTTTKGAVEARVRAKKVTAGAEKPLVGRTAPRERDAGADPGADPAVLDADPWYEATSCVRALRNYYNRSDGTLRNYYNRSRTTTKGLKFGTMA